MLHQLLHQFHQLLELFGKPQWSLIEAHQGSTHLSIGLLMGALLFDLAAILVVKKRAPWREAALWMQVLGTLLLVFTFALGFYGNPLLHKHNEMAQKADWHFRFGVVTLCIFLFLTAWRVARWSKWRRVESTLYALATGLGIALISITGWMGGHIFD
jgi:uncharacterized membrane protein